MRGKIVLKGEAAALYNRQWDDEAGSLLPAGKWRREGWVPGKIFWEAPGDGNKE